ncbi:XP_014788857.1PREDICTED: uncharacterized protein LOC106882630 [Octopus vulgaris]|uniref:XP_014788857.1PREDICTED: uncharacterized protein LOC106882630 n=1 Tax=Octopus vulgaris TaxID=6645 RepID=A0AA36BQ58_OCTVU|nr:XP_014788857.1PREDICTED: uncharacterized protein LOC106882630 [Octopus vulgaris]
MANGILLVLCLLLLENYVMVKGQDFRLDSQDLKIGGSLKLTCSSQSSSIDHWIIKKGQKLLIKTDPNKEFVDPSVSHWKHTENAGSLVVDISPLACHDNGTYVCIIWKGDVKNESKPLDIYVKAPPEKVEIRSNFIILADKEYEFNVGKQIHLICDSEVGNPPGNVDWFITDDLSLKSFNHITENVSRLGLEPIATSCQTRQKISLKYYPNREMKIAIKCSVNNTVGEESFMRIFNIVKNEEKDSSKLIIIVVLCVIIPEIIIAIILGVVLYIRRKRAKKRAMEAAAAEAERKELSDNEYSNNIPMKNINKSSVGGRRNRESRNENDQEKQAMTGAAKA